MWISEDDDRLINGKFYLFQIKGYWPYCYVGRYVKDIGGGYHRFRDVVRILPTFSYTAPSEYCRSGFKMPDSVYEKPFPGNFNCLLSWWTEFLGETKWAEDKPCG